MLQRRDHGFSLMELLIVVAIIGLIASILIPNLLLSIQKARQKRTLSDIRGIGTSWMAWLADVNGAASAGMAARTFEASQLSIVSYPELLGNLRPSSTFFYAQEVPQNDSWGAPYRFYQGAVAGGEVDTIMVCSTGGDLVFEECVLGSIPSEPFISTDFDHDIIWANGYFVSWPEGL